MSELVRKMQEWRAVSLIPSELIDEVKELVREKAALEAKLEAMSQVIEVVRAVLPNMIAKGPLSEASRLDFALQEFDAAQQEQEE